MRTSFRCWTQENIHSTLLPAPNSQPLWSLHNQWSLQSTNQRVSVRILSLCWHIGSQIPLIHSHWHRVHAHCTEEERGTKCFLIHLPTWGWQYLLPGIAVWQFLFGRKGNIWRTNSRCISVPPDVSKGTERDYFQGVTYQPQHMCLVRWIKSCVILECSSPWVPCTSWPLLEELIPPGSNLEDKFPKLDALSSAVNIFLSI